MGRVQLGRIQVDFGTREIIYADGTFGELQLSQLRVLYFLLKHRGRVVSRDDLIRSVWGLNPEKTWTRAVDMQIVEIRKKLRDDARSPQFIKTVRGVGYSLL